ncbi:MAG: alpha/beta hydrolase [Eubacteriales bacterium]|nr:alpha/beta hydrolase [Eubacteriales bacterium]
MYQYSTAKTNIIPAAGTRFAWRGLGDAPGTPIVFFSYLMSSMDDWDPAIADGLAAHFRIFLFDNRGVGRSEGKTPSTIQEMAEDAYRFLLAMNLKKVHILGFSMGGMVAQAFAAAHPEMVDRLILAGTGPSGSVFRDSYTVPLKETTLKAILRRKDPKYYLMFESQTAAGRQAASAFLNRLSERKHDRDMKIRLTSPALKAQIQAIKAWFASRSVDPSRIACPTLVIGGERDGMVSVSCSRELGRLIPGAVLKIYPDCGHGSLFQYPEQFVADVTEFLQA